jgi:hypothetical protein
VERSLSENLNTARKITILARKPKFQSVRIIQQNKTVFAKELPSMRINNSVTLTGKKVCFLESLGRRDVAYFYVVAVGETRVSVTRP